MLGGKLQTCVPKFILSALTEVKIHISDIITYYCCNELNISKPVVLAFLGNVLRIQNPRL